MKSQEALDADLQLSLYHLGLTRRWPHIDPAVISLSLYYIKHNEKLTTVRTPAQTEQTQEHIRSIIRDIEERTTTGDFPPQPSVLCDWCGYKSMCPAWKFLYSSKQTAVRSKQDIEKNIEEYFALKKKDTEITKRIAELQADIKSYMNQEGLTRVFGDEGSIAKTVQERYTYDFEKIKQALLKHNRLDVWEVILTPDDKKLKKALNSLPFPLQEQIFETRSIAKKFEVLTATMKKNAVEELTTEEPRMP